MLNSIKTGLLAFGMSGQVFHAPFIEAHKGFELYATTERHKDRMHAIYPNVKAYPDVVALLADEELELVIVNTPNASHYAYAKMALLAGKHVLLEKPMSCTLAEAEELFKLATAQQKHLFIYQNRRFDSGFKSFKSVIESGKLGQLVEVHFRFDRYRNHIGPKAFKEQAGPGAGLLFDLGPHLIDQAIALWGKPLSSFKTLGYYRANTEVDDYFHLHLQYPNQLQVHLTASMLVSDAREAFVAHGTHGSFRKMHGDVQEAQLLKGVLPGDPNYGIEDEKDAGVLTLIDSNGQKSLQSLAAPLGNYMNFFDCVYDSIRLGHDFPIQKDEVLWQMQILESPTQTLVTY